MIYLAPLLAAIALMIGWGMASEMDSQNASFLHMQQSGIADSVGIYRGSVLTYASAKPTVTGAVADSSLLLPSWFVKPAYLQNYVFDGEAFVFYGSSTDPIGLKLRSAVSYPGESGIAVNGKMTDPASGAVYATLPAAIPNGSFVVMAH